jgi:hypothetical protein
LPHNSIVSDLNVLVACNGFIPYNVQQPTDNQNVRYDTVRIKNLSNSEYIFNRDNEQTTRGN